MLSVTENNNDVDKDFLADMIARIDNLEAVNNSFANWMYLIKINEIEAGVHIVMRTDEIKVITWDRLYKAA